MSLKTISFMLSPEYFSRLLASRITKESIQSGAGLPLYCQTPAEDHFEATFSDRRGPWTYSADRNEEGYLFVWIPRG